MHSRAYSCSLSRSYNYLKHIVNVYWDFIWTIQWHPQILCSRNAPIFEHTNHCNLVNIWNVFNNQIFSTILCVFSFMRFICFLLEIKWISEFSINFWIINSIFWFTDNVGAIDLCVLYRASYIKMKWTRSNEIFVTWILKWFVHRINSVWSPEKRSRHWKTLFPIMFVVSINQCFLCWFVNDWLWIWNYFICIVTVWYVDKSFLPNRWIQNTEIRNLSSTFQSYRLLNEADV